MKPFIAVVDDDHSILDAIRLALEDHVWTIATHLDAVSFLAGLDRGERCDVVVLDPHLEGVDGLGVLRALAGRKAPVVVLSARPHSALVTAMKRIGVAAVIAKPVAEAALAEVIEAALAGRPQHGSG